METRFLEAPGEPVEPGALQISKARDLAGLLLSERLPYVRFIGAHRNDEAEYVVLDIEPEVPQRPVHDIRRLERIVVKFDPHDEHGPDPLALREDFPLVPHVNFRFEEFPRSLCLFEEPYAEQKLRWTAARFLRQLHRWLGRTARGELHEPDQPLEQFLIGATSHVILPPDLFALQPNQVAEELYVTAVSVGTNRYTVIATQDQARAERRGAIPFVGMVIEAEPRTHGILRLQPRSLAQLHAYLGEVGCDLVGDLRERLRRWRTERDDLDRTHLLIVVRLPKRRAVTSTPEAVEVWAFMPNASLLEIGEDLGIFTKGEGYVVPLFGEANEQRQGQGTSLALLNPTPALTTARAAELNGHVSEDEKIVAIGAGALGSQVLINLVRGGYGQWTVVDRDVLLPHNLARHELDGFVLGMPKATGISIMANSLFEESDAVVSVVADALEEGNEVLTEAFARADLIVDLSASVLVGRRLAVDVEGNARRVSIFLNPSGTDLVLLAEDRERRCRLDHLEMCYYREIIHKPELRDHLFSGGERIRYANSCRDVSSQMPQDALAVHAGVAARALRRAVESADASIVIWRAGDDLSISRIDVEPTPAETMEVGDWTLCVNESLTHRLAELRNAKLPNETGGVLIGSYDLTRKIVYVVDTVPSPPDSKEWPTLYIRGAKGLKERVEQIDRLTAGWLTYIGEWHSHPRGTSCLPSRDDTKVFSWLADYMLLDGHPPLMAIVGDQGSAWYLAHLP